MQDSGGVLSLVVVTRRLFFFSSRRRHTRSLRDWSSDVCSSDLTFADHGYVVRESAHCHAHIAAEPRVFQQLPRERSEERRVGKECRSWGSPDHYKKKRREGSPSLDVIATARTAALNCASMEAHT